MRLLPQAFVKSCLLNWLSDLGLSWAALDHVLMLKVC